MDRRLILALLLLTSCASSAATDAVTPLSTTSATTATAPVGSASSVVGAPAPPVSLSPSTTQAATATSVTAAPATIATPTTIAAPTTTPYGMPVADGKHAAYAHVHHDYPASDVFVGCGASIISPVNGVVLETRRIDGWTSAVDNPATRGGKSITILGDDGVRYYLAHFDSVAADIEPGLRVEIGHPLGLMGMTGRAGACHLHFAISPPCPGKEWTVRRGVIWPWRYLDAWRKGEQLSPLPEIEQWVAAQPDACAEAMADPNAPDA